MFVKGGAFMLNECKVVRREQVNTLCVRTRVPFEELPNAIGKAYGQEYGFIQDNNLEPIEFPYAAYFNMDMADLDVEIGVVISTPSEGNENVKGGIINEGEYLTIVHVGPYEECGPSYEDLEKWVRLNGREHTGVYYEFYHNDPKEVKPEEIMTTIMVQLKE
jgi:effector-binding domain-containing protein